MSQWRKASSHLLPAGGMASIQPLTDPLDRSGSNFPEAPMSSTTGSWGSQKTSNNSHQFQMFSAKCSDYFPLSKVDLMLATQ